MTVHIPRLLAGVLLLLWAAPVLAHPGSVAFWHVVVDETQVESRVIVSVEDAGDNAGSLGGSDSADESVHRRMADRLLPHFTVRAGDVVLPGRVQATRLLSSGNIEIVAVHDAPRRGEAVILESTFHEFTDNDHRVIARVERAGGSTPLVLHSGATRHAFAPHASAQTHPARVGSPASMVRLGIEHILTGYDHLVFLACLLLPGGTWRSRAIIVTAFTAAHSLTLGLAAMRLVVLPERFVEAAIAVSIAYVALENVLGTARQRWPAAFGFGLVHGFGFAGMLDLLHLPTSQWLATVLAFNIGVEVGQLAVVALAMPMLAFLARRSWHVRVVQYTSAGVFALAVFWIVERLS